MTRGRGWLLGAGLLALAASIGFQAQGKSENADNANNNGGGIVGSQESLSRSKLTVEEARSVGVFGLCDARTPPDECVFTVEAVRYLRGPAEAEAKFNAVCVDSLLPGGPAPEMNCSPVTRESASFGIDLGGSAGVGGSGGIAAGLSANASVAADGGLSFGLAFPIRRKLRYPLREPERIDGKKLALGGNILLESGLGSITAEHAVVFSHTEFSGSVTFYITKPNSMRIAIGSSRRDGTTACRLDGDSVDCTTVAKDLADDPLIVNFRSFDEYLHAACSLNRLGDCSPSASAAAEHADAVEDDLLQLEPLTDPDEILAELNARRDEIDGLREVARRKFIETRLSVLFDLLRDMEREGLKDEMKTKLRESMADVGEIIDIAKQETGFTDHRPSFDRLGNLDRAVSETELNIKSRIDGSTRQLGQNQEDHCKLDHPATCRLRHIFE